MLVHLVVVESELPGGFHLPVHDLACRGNELKIYISTDATAAILRDPRLPCVEPPSRSYKVVRGLSLRKLLGRIPVNGITGLALTRRKLLGDDVPKKMVEESELARSHKPVSNLDLPVRLPI